MALNPKYEGTLSVFFRCNEVAKAGQVVMYDSSEDNEVKVSDGTDAMGILAQDVYDTPIDEYRPLVGERGYLDAYNGHGVYIQGGVYYTDQFVEGSYNPGDDLYVTSKGKLTNVLNEDSPQKATEADGYVKVGVVEWMDPARGLRFKLTL